MSLSANSMIHYIPSFRVTNQPKYGPPNLMQFDVIHHETLHQGKLRRLPAQEHERRTTTRNLIPEYARQIPEPEKI